LLRLARDVLALILVNSTTRVGDSGDRFAAIAEIQEAHVVRAARRCS
jgi:hypothetical protein